MRRWDLFISAAAVAWPIPLHAQDDIAPSPPHLSSPKPMTVAFVDSNVEPFYEVHPGVLLWLKDSQSRAAASELVAILKNAALDGLKDGPALASSVTSSLTGGTAADDQLISIAWVRYVQALKRPVGGISFGDQSLQLQAPTATAILSDALSSASLADYVERVSRVNPIYSELRADAIASGNQSDPHVQATLDRLRLVPSTGRAILVDAANAELMELENGRIVNSMKVIVGKPDYPTPLLAGKIWYVTFNPYWHIPPDVAKRKVAPIVLKRGVAYLKAARYQTVEAFGGDKEQPIDPSTVDWKEVASGKIDVHIRQLSGPNNMMGAVKFGFDNDFGIFLHDTPHKDLFNKARRNLSLGCVRVEHPQQLAEWLLGHVAQPPDDDFEDNVRIDTGVPIYISYLTALPKGGAIAFAPDLYRLDGGPEATWLPTVSKAF